MKRQSKLLSLILALVLLCGIFAFPGIVSAEAAKDYSNVTIRLAYQYGMQYAPVYVMQQMGYLEQLLPGVKVEWSNLGGGSAMNEGLISGALDVAFMGTPPALIAINAGATFRIACGICVPPAVLMVTEKSGAKSIADLKPTDKIAVPSIGSIQNIMLAMACDKVLGNAHALDNNLVMMANPDAYAALLSGAEVVGHFASMPYIAYEQKDGLVPILTADDCMGSGASIICVTSDKLHGNPDVYAAVLEALEMAIALINGQGDEVITIIANAEKISKEDALSYLNWEGTFYGTELYALTKLGEFMAANGFIKGDFKGASYYTWENAVEASSDK